MMINSISSIFSFYIWIMICTGCISFIIEPFYTFSKSEAKLLEKEKTGKPWFMIFCVTIALLSGICALQRYSNAKESAYPMNFFDSYDEIHSHENFKYKIVVYDENELKQIRVHDKENDLNFDFIAHNDMEKSIEYFNPFFKY